MGQGQMTHNTSDIDDDLRPLESYAIASLLGCGALCMAGVVVGLVAIALMRWL